MSDTRTIEDIFRGRMFYIPDYQRGYAWELRNWKDLTEDLELMATKRPHYIGTFVVRKRTSERVRDEHGQSYELLDVIDGQQRLTTIVILLHTICEELKLMNESALAEGLGKMYLAVRNRNGQLQTKVTLNRDSRDFFYNNILRISPNVSGPTIRSHENLLNASQYMQGYFSNERTHHGTNYRDWLIELLEKITQRFAVILYEVESEMDAAVIFETMNDRGRLLTDLEKSKNHLLYLASKLELESVHDLDLRINQTWNHIFEELMLSGLSDDENESQLLRVHWLMAYDSDPKKWKGYQSIKDHFDLRNYKNRHQELLKDVTEYVDSLTNTVTAYCDIHKPHRTNAFKEITNHNLRANVIEVSEKLVRLGASLAVRATFLPLLVAVRLKANDFGKTYLHVLDLCEKFDFRVYQWEGARASAAQTIFFRLGRTFYKKLSIDQLLKFLIQTVHDYSSNARFAEGFQIETEDWYKWSALKYFLYEYEQHLAEKAREPLRMQWSDLWDIKRDTIEHILPQTPTETWLKAFPDESRRERWTHDIGNLTLTYDNSYLKNKSFLEKKGDPSKPFCYAGSSFFVERQLAAYSQWTENEIILRREEIREWAINRWHVDEVAGSKRKVESGSLEKVLRLAEENGMLKEFLAIVDLSNKNNLFLRPWVKSLMISPESNHSVSLFTISPRSGHLYIGVWFENVQEYVGIRLDKLKSIFETDDLSFEDEITADKFDGFYSRLKLMFPDQLQK